MPGASNIAASLSPRSLEVIMTRFKAQGLSIHELLQSPAAEWRRSAFQWLRPAASDRRIAAFCTREAESNFCRIAKQSAIERHRVALAHARERHAWACACGHRLA